MPWQFMRQRLKCVEAIILIHNPYKNQFHSQSLDTVGCAEPLVELGTKARAISVHDRTSVLFSNDFTTLAPYTRYPFALILPQNITERVLTAHLESLGVRVFRPYRVVGMKCNELDENVVDVSFEGGETIKASYVIGADGARSAVCMFLTSHTPQALLLPTISCY